MHLHVGRAKVSLRSYESRRWPNGPISPVEPVSASPVHRGHARRRWFALLAGSGGDDDARSAAISSSARAVRARRCRCHATAARLDSGSALRVELRSRPHGSHRRTAQSRSLNGREGSMALRRCQGRSSSELHPGRWIWTDERLGARTRRPAGPSSVFARRGSTRSDYPRGVERDAVRRGGLAGHLGAPTGRDSRDADGRELAATRALAG